ncbi:MAG: MbtH family protein [Isosphaeraceae bacterium]
MIDSTTLEAQSTFIVVVNDEQQYSIWFADRDLPAGWHDAGKNGTKQECLDYVDSVWVDMRPLSLRRSMERLDTE